MRPLPSPVKPHEIPYPHDDLEVQVKGVFPRHTGILGTTGSGKSTTVSNIVSQLKKAGFATILIDTEGEYTAINESTEDEHMIAALKQRRLKSEVIVNTTIYHLAGEEPNNPNHPDICEFRLNFSELSPHSVTEILD